MRIATFDADTRQIRIEDAPMPVVIKVHRCGICGSNVSMTSGGAFSLKTGQFGHEYSGEIV
ncbi:hypothetical protein EBBID32_27780 [Sphingobium indicum BiD32]|uniref:Alcohol dehydrogenase-like N-terminal domain-containing protein n=1 Tax=Sphingobium indicum BiD32 TaxID=1301087 RepID=N1MMI3_9SPHN|nr:hypothetical protein EBBID32_27780 [Sphingobium indicum BiD32]